MSDDVRKDKGPAASDDKAEVKTPDPTSSSDAKAESTKKSTAKTAPKETVKAEGGDKAAAAKPAADGADAKTAEKPAAKAAAKPAAKPKKAPPPPDPRVEAAKALAEKMKVSVTKKFGDASVEEAGNAHRKPMLLIRSEDWLKVVDFLRTDEAWKFNYIECMAGADYPDYLEVVIFVQSTEKDYFACLKTRTPRDNAEVPSLVPIFPGVNWEEREIYDLLGVNFSNHPDMRRIMMWDDFEGHPLRKDYSESD